MNDNKMIDVITDPVKKINKLKNKSDSELIARLSKAIREVQLPIDSKYKQIEDHLYLINREKIDYFLENDFYCPTVMEVVDMIIRFYMTQANTMKNNTDAIQTLISQDSLRWFTNFSLLATDKSQESTIYRSGLRFLSDTILIKTPQTSDGNVNLLYEAIFGHALNKFRNKTPCFMYVFGAFNCAPPLNAPPNICSTNDIYLIVEFIKNASTLLSILDMGELTADELFLIIMQILYSLQIVSPTKFVHNDLHPGNIMIRRLKFPIQIPYTVPLLGTFYITTKFVPSIIDYGFSRIETVDGEVIGNEKNKALQLSLSTEYYFPGVDSFKLISSITRKLAQLISMNKQNINIAESYNMMRKIFFPYYINAEFPENKIGSREYFEKYNNIRADLPISYLTSDNQLRSDIIISQSISILINYIYVNFTDYYNRLLPQQPTPRMPIITLSCKPFDEVLSKITEKTSTCQGSNYMMNSSSFTDYYGTDRYWYDCAKFYFDGVFNVIELPINMTLYHGSGVLAYFDAEYPLGIDYYKIGLNPLTKQQKEMLKNPGIKNSKKTQFLRSIQPVTLSYFGDYAVAAEYSQGEISVGGTKYKCGTNCIHAYRLKKKAIFIDLYDPLNLQTLFRFQEEFIRDGSLTRDDYKIISDAYRITNSNQFIDLTKYAESEIKNQRFNIDPVQKFQTALDPRRRFEMQNVGRGSLRNPDYKVPKAILNMVINKYGYAGFINPRTYYTGSNNAGKYRFGEIVFDSTVLDYVKRDYTNYNDWQYQNIKAVYGSMKKLINNFQKYKTSNIDFHAGNLYEHSVWTALYTQYQFVISSQWASGIPDSYRALAVFAAFVHDIGKGGDNETLYYDKPDHPKIGYQYLSGARNYLLNEKGDKLDIKDIYNEAGFNNNLQIYTIQIVAGIHWLFGEKVSKLDNNNGVQLANEYLDVFIKFLKQTNIIISIPEQQFILLICILISAMDVKATQPFIDNISWISLTQKVKNDPKFIADYINAFAIDFPFLSNRGKNHRGGNKYNDFNFEQKGLIMRNFIIDQATIRLK